MLEEHLIKKLKARQEELAQDVLTTPLPDYAAYRQVVGHSAGLAEALQLIEDYLKGREDL